MINQSQRATDEMESASNSKTSGNKKQNGRCKSRKPKGRGSKPEGKGRESSNSKKFDSGDTVHAYNDVAWYSKNPQALAAAASFSYSTPLGAEVTTGRYFNSDDPAFGVSYSIGSDSIPGLMSLEVAPTIGVADTVQSPANLAAQNIYSYVRYANSGSKNYDIPDLFLYLLAMDSCYAFWNFCKRLYLIAQSYNQANWYMPRAYFAACNVDFDNLMGNLADFRAWLNVAAARLTSFNVPATMSIFVRHSWMFSNIYTDSNIPKAQQYIFVPSLFYKYNETGSPKGGYLEPIQWCDGNIAEGKAAQRHQFTLQDIKDTMEDMISKLMMSEDIGVMSGDILKAYGTERLFKLTPVGLDDTLSPVYDEVVLNQIHNATVISSSIWYNNLQDTWKIKQDPASNRIVFQPSLNHNRVHQKGKMVNMPWAAVTPENTMEATRLITLTKELTTPGANVVSVGTCGTEIVLQARIWYNNFITTVPGHTETYSVGLYNIPFATVEKLQFESTTTQKQFYTDTLRQLAQFRMVTNFDWHPLIDVFITDPYTFSDVEGNITYDLYLGTLGDISTYTVMSFEDVERINLTAIMSEFDVPAIGSF